MSIAGRSATDEAVPLSESNDRLCGPDVVRAVALIGVVVMNYHGYLMLRSLRTDVIDSALNRFFDPFEGPLSTRFASTFVLTAGVGITLMTRRVEADRVDGVAGAAKAVTEMRWRLVRRGLALYVLGQLLDVIWPGTIIIYYGAMFAIASLLFTLATRWIIMIGIAAALAGWWVSLWSFWQVEDGASVAWLRSPASDSIRRYVFDLTVNGTHPLLPWLAFLCAGIVLGRTLEAPDWQLWCGGIGLVLFGVATIVSTMTGTAFTELALSRHPFDRGVVYVASALGTSLIAFAGISWLADRAIGPAAVVVEVLREAGQMTLTLYIAHILLFNLFVDWIGWVEPAGLGTALTFAFGFWVIAMVLGAWWHRRYARGPAEWAYRAIGG
ncbi:MAG: DUF418 domain-containing protein [Ilumatobacter sp.]|nr:DUF418 domain-containing protein [Ilumatobacter sp.]